jgi:hypothetical protein
MVSTGFRPSSDPGKSSQCRCHEWRAAARGFLCQIVILKTDTAASYPPVAAQKLNDRLTGDAFAAAGFTDNADKFSRLNLKAHAAHGMNITIARMKGGLQVIEF